MRGQVALIGDAAHTMRPTFGQGAALAMEDAIILANYGAAGLSQRRLRMMALSREDVEPSPAEKSFVDVELGGSLVFGYARPSIS